MRRFRSIPLVDDHPSALRVFLVWRSAVFASKTASELKAIKLQTILVCPLNEPLVSSRFLKFYDDTFWLRLHSTYARRDSCLQLQKVIGCNLKVQRPLLVAVQGTDAAALRVKRGEIFLTDSWIVCVLGYEFFLFFAISFHQSRFCDCLCCVEWFCAHK